jgi:hypothetical protein
MVSGVCVDDNGNCSSINVLLKKSGLHLDKRKMYVHYENEDENLMILSTKAVDDVLHEEADILTFSLPPPLNTYIYPKPVIILRGSLKSPQELTCDSFVQHCTKFKASINDIAASLTVYDVPLNETTYEDACDTDNEEESVFEGSDEDNEDEHDEDDDWEVDDEEVVVS